MTKIGFSLMGSEGWQAGSVYLSDLLAAIREISPNDTSISLILPASESHLPPEMASLVDDVVRPPTFRRLTMRWALDRSIKRVFDRDLFEHYTLKRHGIDLLALDCRCMTWMPTLAWIPDFQHVHLPEMFSEADLRHRDRMFMSLIKRSAKIILISQSVKQDFDLFAPAYSHKARVVNPVSYIPESIYETDPEPIRQLYNLPKNFIYLPNQFWKHKNHATVFEALSILKQEGKEIFLVCSGYPGDSRHLSHFAGLLQQLSLGGIRDQVAFLGLIPRDHVFMLMRQSVCVLNPSLFEGYGMTVDEARSIGKQVLASDIPSHREQNPPGAVFFDPHDSQDLAAKLNELWHTKLAGPDEAMEAVARQRQPGRRTDYAKAFMAVVSEIEG